MKRESCASTSLFLAFSLIMGSFAQAAPIETTRMTCTAENKVVSDGNVVESEVVGPKRTVIFAEHGYEVSDDYAFAEHDQVRFSAVYDEYRVSIRILDLSAQGAALPTASAEGTLTPGAAPLNAQLQLYLPSEKRTYQFAVSCIVD